MAFTFIARMKIFPEKKDQFIKACEKLEKAVEENEEGCFCLLYTSDAADE